MNAFESLSLVIFGSIIGSFLNVCIYRIPANKSILHPRSYCPKCYHQIAWYDNIPIISFILLRAHCRHCGASISIRYPIVEAITAILTLLLAWRVGLRNPDFWAFYLLTCALIVITFIDLHHFIIPDVISYPGIIIGILVSWLFTSVGLKNSLLGFATGFLFLLVVSGAHLLITKREGMGGGDIKLIGMIGAFIGWQGVIFTILSGSIIGTVIGSMALLISRRDARTPIPFGPFLSAGAIIYILVCRDWFTFILNFNR